VKAAAAVAAVCGLILLISLFLSWAQIVCVQAPFSRLHEPSGGSRSGSDSSGAGRGRST